MPGKLNYLYFQETAIMSSLSWLSALRLTIWAIWQNPKTEYNRSHLYPSSVNFRKFLVNFRNYKMRKLISNFVITVRIISISSLSTHRFQHNINVISLMFSYTVLVSVIHDDIKPSFTSLHYIPNIFLKFI